MMTKRLTARMRRRIETRLAIEVDEINHGRWFQRRADAYPNERSVIWYTWIDGWINADSIAKTGLCPQSQPIELRCTKCSNPSKIKDQWTNFKQQNRAQRAQTSAKVAGNCSVAEMCGGVVPSCESAYVVSPYLVMLRKLKKWSYMHIRIRISTPEFNHF